MLCEKSKASLLQQDHSMQSGAFHLEKSRSINSSASSFSLHASVAHFLPTVPA